MGFANMKLPRYMDPRPCRPSRDPESVRQIIETESAGKIDPADHPMSHWWHCATCRDWHKVEHVG